MMDIKNILAQTNLVSILKTKNRTLIFKFNQISVGSIYLFNQIKVDRLR